MNLDHLFDCKQILKDTPNKDKLSITLKKGNKGVSIFATKDIKKGDKIAYYKMKIYSNTKKGLKSFTTDNSIEELCEQYKKVVNKTLPEYKDETTYQYKKKLVKAINDETEHFLYLKDKTIIPPKKDMYHFTVYNKKGYEYKKLTGDLYDGSLPKPKNNIPYWGYLSNEPMCDETYNADVDVSNDKISVKEGDSLTYTIIADKDIKKGEEVMWCYGSNYRRSYPTSCNKKSCKK
jgi:hypothetical protein